MSRYAPASVVVLASGRGSNLGALLAAERSAAIPARIRAVISDVPTAGALRRGADAGIDACCIERSGFASREAYEAALTAQLERYRPSLLVLAGFLRILSADFVARFTGRMLNLHPSLLPRHPGLRTHARALTHGDRFHGATVHFVVAEVDAGPRIIQYRIAVRADDDEASLAARVQAGEHVILPRAVGWFGEGRLRLAGQDVILDGRPLAKPVRVEEPR